MVMNALEKWHNVMDDIPILGSTTFNYNSPKHEGLILSRMH
jgi:hypothetical protein